VFAVADSDYQPDVRAYRRRRRRLWWRRWLFWRTTVPPKPHLWAGGESRATV